MSEQTGTDSFATWQGPISTLILGLRGGTGKTTLAEMLVNAHDATKAECAVITVDSQPRLSEILGKRVDLSIDIGADLTALVENPKLAFRHYNPILPILRKADVVGDFGAQSAPLVFQWMQTMQVAEGLAEKGVYVQVVTCTDRDGQSIEGARQVMETAREVFDGYGNVRYVLVKSPHRGPFDAAEKHPDFRSLEHADWLEKLSVPMNRSEYWSATRGLRGTKTIGDVMHSISTRAAAEATAADLGIDEDAWPHERTLMFNWFREMNRAILPLLRPDTARKVAGMIGVAEPRRAA